MAIVTEMEPEAAQPEPLALGAAPVAVVDVKTINEAVAQAIAAHMRPQRARWQMMLAGTLLAGLLALAGIAYSTLRSDITALGTELRADIKSVETNLRAEMREEFARVHMVLLDHTDRLARLEAIAGVPRADDG